MKKYKEEVKKLLPPFALRLFRQYKLSKFDKKFQGLNNKELFTKVYSEKHWGGDNDTPFYSGSGSHKSDLVNEYVLKVREFLKSLDGKVTVVDIGCGDFAIGSKIYDCADSYLGCDIVEPLINHNKKEYSNFGVNFQCLDLVEDELPSARVATIREVLQHLKNRDILNFLKRAQSKYEYLIVTETIPRGKFTHNIEKSHGPSTRIRYNSGVVLTSPPFNLVVKNESVACELNSSRGVIKTVIYKL